MGWAGDEICEAFTTSSGEPCRCRAKFVCNDVNLCGRHRGRGAVEIPTTWCEALTSKGSRCTRKASDLVESRFLCTQHSPRDRVCAICYMTMKSDAMRVLQRCGHRFHTGCVMKWEGAGGTTCPLCRTRIQQPDRNPASTPVLEGYQRVMVATLAVAIEGENPDSMSFRSRLFDLMHRSTLQQNVSENTFANLLEIVARSDDSAELLSNIGFEPHVLAARATPMP